MTRAGLTNRATELDPPPEYRALLVGDVRLVGRRHRARHDSALLNSRDARHDLLRRIEHHAGRRRTERQVRRLRRVTRRASPIDDAARFVERHHSARDARSCRSSRAPSRREGNARIANSTATLTAIVAANASRPSRIRESNVEHVSHRRTRRDDREQQQPNSTGDRTRLENGCSPSAR